MKRYILAFSLLFAPMPAASGDAQDLNYTGTVITKNEIDGGGIHSSHNYMQAGEVTGNTYLRNTITIAEDICGGGIIGAYHGSSVGDISNNNFSGNVITAVWGRLVGGGIIGSYHGSSVGDISGNNFSGNQINALILQGGGIVGNMRSSNNGGDFVNWVSRTGNITNNNFEGNIINVQRYIHGGGIIGASEFIGTISGNTFKNNQILGGVSGAGLSDRWGDIWGGVIHVSKDVIVADSIFLDNTITTPGYVFGGAILVDTTPVTDLVRTPAELIPKSLTLTLRATAGHELLFENNIINDADGTRANAVAFQAIDSVHEYHSQVDGILNIETEGNGLVMLFDPIFVNQNSGKVFTMNVSGDGRFFWSGDNKFIVDTQDPRNVVTFGAGTSTLLLDGFSLDAQKHYWAMDDKASMIVYPNTSINAYNVILAGDFSFVVDDVATNNAGSPMMVITASNGIDFRDMKPRISVDGHARELLIGDRFYLVQSNLTPKMPDLTSFTSAIKHGSLLESTAIFKLLDGNNFVAEVVNVKEPGNPDPGPGNPDPGIPVDPTNPGKPVEKVVSESGLMTESAMMGILLANQGGDLVAGKGIRSALDAAKEFEWGAFAVVDAGTMRANSDADINASSVNMVAGISRAINSEIGRLTAGLFFEYGSNSYDVHGSGNAKYMGGGLLGHWKLLDFGPGNFYVDASLRAGQMTNDYESDVLADGFGRKASYDTDSMYYGVHAGAGYVLNLTEDMIVDTYIRYFWLHQDGTDKRISTGDSVDFDSIDSNRTVAGMRFNYKMTDFVSPYIGLAYEHEFAGESQASVHNYELASSSLSGDTGIAELGIEFKDKYNSPWFIDLGVQGFTGKREGVGGSLRLGYTF